MEGAGFEESFSSSIRTPIVGDRNRILGSSRPYTSFPRIHDFVRDPLNSNAARALREHNRSSPAHPPRIALHQLLEREEIVADVLADRRMRAAAGFDRADALDWKRLVANQELRILAGEDVVRHHTEGVAVPEGSAQCKQKRGLA